MLDEKIAALLKTIDDVKNYNILFKETKQYDAFKNQVKERFKLLLTSPTAILEMQSMFPSLYDDIRTHARSDLESFIKTREDALAWARMDEGSQTKTIRFALENINGFIPTNLDELQKMRDLIQNYPQLFENYLKKRMTVFVTDLDSAVKVAELVNALPQLTLDIFNYVIKKDMIYSADKLKRAHQAFPQQQEQLEAHMKKHVKSLCVDLSSVSIVCNLFLDSKPFFFKEIVTLNFFRECAEGSNYETAEQALGEVFTDPDHTDTLTRIKTVLKNGNGSKKNIHGRLLNVVGFYADGATAKRFNGLALTDMKIEEFKQQLAFTTPSPQ